CWNPFAQERAAFDLAANGFDRDLRARKKPPRERFVFTHQAEQQMLRFDRRRAKLRSFVTSEENYPARFFSVAFEHRTLRKLLMIATRWSGQRCAHYSATTKR